jgi:hypothetical protein
MNSQRKETNSYGKTKQVFRHGGGCADVVFAMNRLDHLALAKGIETCKIVVDNTKAYDMVNREVRWMVQERRGLPMHLINLIKSKLKGTPAKVKYNSKLSEGFNLSHGLTQGGILSKVYLIL